MKALSDGAGIRLTVSLLAIAVAAAAILYLPDFTTEAGTARSAGKGLVQRTTSAEPSLPDYDIRRDKSRKAWNSLMRFRGNAGVSAFGIADRRDTFVRGEENLRSKVPTLKIEYNRDLRIPEVITPDVWKAEINNLSAPTGSSRAETLRNFVKQNNDLVGIDDNQANSLKVVADYSNPEGPMGFALLQQRINGIQVFRGEIKAGFRKDGSMVRVINNLAPGVDYSSVSKSFGDPLRAVEAAARNLKIDPASLDSGRTVRGSDKNMFVYGDGDDATTAEKIYFPTEIGVMRPAWKVLIWQPNNAFYVVVDAETGTPLWRKNITNDQTESATYSVYRNTNAMIDVAHSPFPWLPGPIDPSLPVATSSVARANVSKIGNEGSYSFNDLGWITDGANMGNGHTKGNAVEAGLDIDGSDGVDAPVAGVNRVFDFSYNPYNPNDGTGDDPTTADHRNGSVVQLFYICNWFHDEMYRLGWTETAFNFQDDNFGRGGNGSDSVRCEAQDSSGFNNANFSTPSDGGRGRMQMYVWNITSPSLDGSIDADIVIHEFTHGLSNRLHMNVFGFTSNMSKMMGEGFSDFYAHSLLSQPSDPLNGIYTLSGWATSDILGGLSSYYYGIRRFPKAPIAFTGGPNNRPHNPITFADIDQEEVDYSDGAFPAPVAGHLSNTADQEHSGGEVWSAALWEVRNLIVGRLGWDPGNRRTLQIVTDGMKMAPSNPTYLQERDAIIAAASAQALAPEASADVSDVREGFRRRGMGFTATVDNEGTGSGTARVTEAFDFPNANFADPIVVSDSVGDNDGYPEPGENVLITVTVENSTGATVDNVQVNINGGTNVPYGNIADASMVTMDIPYHIPSSLAAACGENHTININVSSDIGAQPPVVREFQLGEPVGGGTETFTSTDGPITIPAGAPATTNGPADVYASTIEVSGVTGERIIEVKLNNLTHTWVGDLDFLLEGPGGQKFVLMSDAFFADNSPPSITSTLTIRDDAPGLMPSGDPPPTSGTFMPTNHSLGDAWDPPAPGGPYENPAPAASATLASTFGMDGSAMNGTWKLWVMDDQELDSGDMQSWTISFESSNFLCNAGSAPYDFDNDGRTDTSVFRPIGAALTSNGAPEGNVPGSEWWILRSGTNSPIAYGFGQSTDIPVPADYTGDGKTDVAFFRPSTGEWYVLRSEDESYYAFPFGTNGDIPVPGDFDGDGMADAGIFRPSQGLWFILRSGDQGVTIFPFGTNGDKPTVDDFDGDGMDDIAIFRPSAAEWWQQRSSLGVIAYQFGGPGDRTVVGQWTPDNRADVAFYRPSTGEWYVLRSEDESYFAFPFGGAAGDIPVPGDYDGDGKTDQGIFRPAESLWITFGSTSQQAQFTVFGAPTDTPLPSIPSVN